MRPHRVLIGGLPYFGRMLAGLLAGPGWQVRYLDSAGKRPTAWLAAARAVASADLVYLVGGQVQHWTRLDWLVRLSRKPVVMHWVGSDVTFARAIAAGGRASSCLVTQPEHWAEVSWTAEELRPLGIEAAIVPLTSAHTLASPPPLPETFTILAYLPAERPEFYGRSSVMRVAAAFPEARILVAGAEGDREDTPSNVEFLGWQTDMQSVYARTSVLLRRPEHDGLSFMVLEALAAGRHVIWNHPLNGVIEAEDEGTACDEIARLLALHEQGGLRLNERGRAAAREHYDPETVRDRILGRFERLIVA